MTDRLRHQPNKAAKPDLSDRPLTRHLQRPSPPPSLQRICPPPTHVARVTPNNGRADSARPNEAVFRMISAVSARVMSSPPLLSNALQSPKQTCRRRAPTTTVRPPHRSRAPRHPAHVHSHRSLLPLVVRTTNSLSASLSVSSFHQLQLCDCPQEQTQGPQVYAQFSTRQ